MGAFRVNSSDAAETMTDAGQQNVLDEKPEEQAAGSGALESLMDGIEGSGEDGAVSVGDVMESFEHRSVGALISVFAFLAALPVVGGIPGMSVGTATLILLILGQSLLHRKGGMWIPGFLARRELEQETLEKGAEKVRPYVRRIDHWMRPRLVTLTRGRVQRLAMVVAMVVLTLTFYPLAFVPWGVTAPSLGVLALGLAMMTGDGVLALLGYAMLAGTVLTAAIFL